MLAVRCPIIFIAAERGTPARSKFRTAVRRKSWGIRPGTPAFLHAVSQDRRKLLIGSPLRCRTHGIIRPVASWIASVCSNCCLRASRNSGTRGNIRPSLFFVSPGSSRSHPELKSTCDHWRVKISESIRHPVMYATVATGLRSPGRCARTARNWSASKKTLPRVVFFQLRNIRSLRNFFRSLSKPKHSFEGT